jgi:3-oxoacyl-[acyl-carrier-protein] synthase-3
MYILGIGAAHPDVEVTDDILSSLGLKPTDQEARTLARSGVRTRRASLPLQYIKDTGNKEVLDGRPVAVATPTTLAVAAARQALERASISSEQLGLILADTATPYQTCPSEAQRVGCALGVKIPAYDVVVGAASLPLYLELLSSWKPERIPEYVLCVSTNTLTQHVQYGDSSALPAYLYGDAASAFVLSPRQSGKMRVVSSFVESSPHRAVSSVVERHISCAAQGALSKDEVVETISRVLKRIAPTNVPSRVVGPQLYSGEFSEYENALGLRAGSMISGTRESGYALGASSGVAVSVLWDSIRSGDTLAVVHAGDGVWGGSVVVASE